MEFLIRLVIILIVIFLLYHLFMLFLNLFDLYCYIIGTHNLPMYFKFFDRYKNPFSFGLMYILYAIYIFLYLNFNIVFWILLFIFVVWLIIKYIIPVVWLLFIPFIPFIIPIPLRAILLAIPPFPQLTDAGILPFMEKILNIIISPGSLINILRSIFEDTFDFLYTSTNYIYPNYGEDIKKSFENIRVEEKNKIKPSEIKSDDTTYDDISYNTVLEEKENSDSYKLKTKQLNDEIKQNILGDTILTNPDMSLYDKTKASTTNNMNYVKYNSQALNKYIALHKE